jgi:hypothetical protein
MKEHNRIERQATDQQVIDGIRADLQGMPTLYLASKVFTPASLEQQIQSRIDAAQAVDAAKAAWLAAIQAYQGIDRSNRLVLRDLKRLVIGACGEQSPKLAHFGFTPPLKVTLTEAQKAAAAAKRAATRKARGTLGPKARLAIKGDIAGGTPET